VPRVTVIPGGDSFACQGRQSILDAALAASVALDYGCSSGTCGQCVGRLKEGDILKVRHHDFAVKDSDRLRGDFLLCAYTAASPEVVIEATVATGGDDIPWQQIESRLRKLEWLSDDVAAVVVQTPRTDRLRFLPGQNVCLALKDGLSKDLPIASCPCDDRNIEFHLRRNSDDEFCKAMLNANRSPTTVTIDGPWGSAPRNTSGQVTLCLAYDTCIAPLRSWIEQQLTDDPSQSIRLYWSAADESGFYLTNLFRAWSDAFDTFRFETMTSAETGKIPHIFENRIIDELRSPVGVDQTLVAGPEPFVSQVNTLLDREYFPVSNRYVHSTKRP
jgi:CDP-4-dehydro-6-deoxyglucose reductase